MADEFDIGSEIEELIDESEMQEVDTGNWDDLDFSDIYDGTGEEIEDSDQSEDDESDEEYEDEDDVSSGEEDEEEPESKPKKGGRYLKYNGEKIFKSYEEVDVLAQKGMNYDKVKEERDELRISAKDYDAVAEENKSRGEFLKELAESYGVSEEELMLNVRANLLVEKGEADDIDEARDMVRQKQKASKKAEETKKSEEDKRQASYEKFTREYPDVKAEDIPQEVWQEFIEGKGDLTERYAVYENKKLREEKKHRENEEIRRKASAGSKKSSGGNRHYDSIDSSWEAACREVDGV